MSHSTGTLAHDDPVESGEETVVESGARQVDPLPGPDPVEDRLGDRLWLLVDLLHHECVVTALLGRLFVPGHGLGVTLDGLTVEGLDRDAFGGRSDYLPVLDRQHFSGFGHEGRDRRRYEGLTLPQTHGQRGLPTGPDQQARQVPVHRNEGEVPPKGPDGRPDGIGQVTIEVGRKQVGDDLGIGLR
jgi:hypothetical protein